jgi:hypothetical protein
MMMRATLWGALASSLVLSPLLARDLSGQGVSSAECDKAAAIVGKGHATETDGWAFAALRPCGAAGGRAFVAGIAHYTTETDVAALQDFMTQVDNWRDASIFDAVTALATSSAATPQARVFAVRHLILLVQPNFLLTYGGLTSKPDTTVEPGLVMVQQGGGCAAQMISAPHGSIRGSPLPADYEARIRATLASLASSPAVPVAVRYASRCVPSPQQ